MLLWKEGEGGDVKRAGLLAGLVVVLVRVGLWGRAQAPHAEATRMPAPLVATQDILPVTIVRGHSVTIWADARRMTMRHSEMSNEEIVDIDTSVRGYGEAVMAG